MQRGAAGTSTKCALPKTDTHLFLILGTGRGRGSCCSSSISTSFGNLKISALITAPLPGEDAAVAAACLLWLLQAIARLIELINLGPNEVDHFGGLRLPGYLFGFQANRNCRLAFAASVKLECMRRAWSTFWVAQPGLINWPDMRLPPCWLCLCRHRCSCLLLPSPPSVPLLLPLLLPPPLPWLLGNI